MPGRKEEAKKAAKLLSGIDFHLAFTSDLKRAYETFEIIKKELHLNIPIVKESSLKERHYGIYTGKNKWDIQKKVGKKNFKRLRRGWDEQIPEGETLKDVSGRVVPYYLSNIHPHIANGKNVLIVAHGNSNRVLIKHLEGIVDERVSEIEMETGEVIIYQLDSRGSVVKKEKRKESP